MSNKFSLLAIFLVLLSACSPAKLEPIVADTTLIQTQPVPLTFTTTSTPKSASSLTPRPSHTPTLIVEEATPTTLPMYVLACAKVPTGGYYIKLASQRTLHMMQINFSLLETTGTFIDGKLPSPTLTMDTSGGAVFGHTETELAACQTAGSCTAAYEAEVLFMKITCVL